MILFEEESAELRDHGVWHYTTPFAERTDIVVSATFVAEERELIRRELTEPHGAAEHEPGLRRGSARARGIGQGRVRSSRPPPG